MNLFLMAGWNVLLSRSVVGCWARSESPLGFVGTTLSAVFDTTWT